MKKSDLIIKNKELYKEDTVGRTYGCRHSNPEICSNNGIPGKCAFSSDDNICKNPPKSWKKTFEELKSKENRI